MISCTCNRALPASQIGEFAVPNMKERSVRIVRFDMTCPVHRVISAVNGVEIPVSVVDDSPIDKPLTAREKRQKAHKAKRQQES